MSVELHVVGRTGKAGTTHAILTDMVSMAPLRDVRGQAGSFRFGLHNLDPKLPQVRALEREVQVWQDGALLAGRGWVVPVTPESTIDGGRDVTEFDCRGLLWYFDRLVVGDADRRNYLVNGSFGSATLDPWTRVGVTADRDTTRVVGPDPASAKLTQATAGTDTYLQQTVTITAPAVGALMTVAAWFYVNPSGFVGEAYGKRALFVQRSVGGVVKDFDVAGLDNGVGESPVLGTWQRRVVTIQIPPNATEQIQVRLYAPGGVIWWDEVVLVAMDSLSFLEVDQGLVADGLVVHAQAPAFGKVDLNIGRVIPTTGVKRTIHYQHADHASIGRSLADLTTLDNGYDHSIDTDDTNRSYVVHWPRKGTGRPAVAWSELVRVSLVPVDGTQAATAVIAPAEGSGPDREEGFARDPTLHGGLALEEVLPPSSLPVGALDAKAAESLRLRSRASRFSLTFGPGLRVNSMFTGDTFDGPSTPHGGVNLSGRWRVSETSHDLVVNCLSVVADWSGEALYPAGALYPATALYPAGS